MSFDEYHPLLLSVLSVCATKIRCTHPALLYALRMNAELILQMKKNKAKKKGCLVIFFMLLQ
jgi:hypothetical protein